MVIDRVKRCVREQGVGKSSKTIEMCETGRCKSLGGKECVDSPLFYLQIDVYTCVCCLNCVIVTGMYDAASLSFQNLLFARIYAQVLLFSIQLYREGVCNLLPSSLNLDFLWLFTTCQWNLPPFFSNQFLLKSQASH